MSQKVGFLTYIFASRMGKNGNLIDDETRISGVENFGKEFCQSLLRVSERMRRVLRDHQSNFAIDR